MRPLSSDRTASTPENPTESAIRHTRDWSAAVGSVLLMDEVRVSGRAAVPKTTVRFLFQDTSPRTDAVSMS